MIVQATDPLDPIGWNEAFSASRLLGKRPNYYRFIPIGRQFPNPLAASPKPSPNRFYPKRLLGSLEELRMRNALTFAEQPCRSGHRFELRYAQGGVCERISQEFSHSRISRPVSQDHLTCL
jgi:hypothetical protein